MKGCNGKKSALLDRSNVHPCGKESFAEQFTAPDQFRKECPSGQLSASGVLDVWTIESDRVRTRSIICRADKV